MPGARVPRCCLEARAKGKTRMTAVSREHVACVASACCLAAEMVQAVRWHLPSLRCHPALAGILPLLLPCRMAVQVGQMQTLQQRLQMHRGLCAPQSSKWRPFGTVLRTVLETSTALDATAGPQGGTPSPTTTPTDSKRTPPWMFLGQSRGARGRQKARVASGAWLLARRQHVASGP